MDRNSASVDFAKMQEIFLAGVERHRPEEWDAYLDQVCAGDDEMRRQVNLLLKAHREAGSVPGAAPREQDENDPCQIGAERPGMVVGPYKLIEPIGEGGMGTVWMAQQTEPVKRVVALKLVKAGMDSKQVLARFEAERQALALMDHPNIARVLDGGSVGSGSRHTSNVPETLKSSTTSRPYFVMDLVKGVPITRYCDEHHLTPRQRLELFVPVCHAIQHAHQKGIIHRDLKPSNVLVALYDDKPVPKIIDFGVAKATGQTLTEQTLVTGFGYIVGTLEYMSPEQAEVNQLDIDTRSDIYSLGVLLYELLTGSPPFSPNDPATGGLLETLRVIREDEPTRPSSKLSTAKGLPALAANRGTEPAKLTKLVRGELDWIVMKALEKDRNQRYETADGFALDVQRYLADEPVQACPPSVAYRLRKFARRNRGPVLAASLLLLTLLGGIIGTSWKWAEAIQARNDEADLRRETNRLLQESEWMLYASRINLAQQAWENNNASLAFHYLDSCRPDYRGWEHDYLFTLFHSNHRTYRNGVTGAFPDGVASLAVSRDGNRIATCGLGTVNVWNADTGERILNLTGHTGGVVSVAFSPDGKRVASGSHDNTVIVWDAETGERILSLEGHKHHIQCVAFSPDGKRIAAGADETMKVWDAATGELALTVTIPSFPVRSVAWSADGNRIVGGQTDDVHVWDAHTGKTAVSLRWNNPSGNCVAFSRNGMQLASGGDDRTISLWDVSTGRRTRTFHGHTEPVTSVAFSPDGEFIISGSEDKTVRIWNKFTGLELRALKGHTDMVTSVATMPDGKRIVSGSRDGTMKIWDAVWGEGERLGTRVLRRDVGSIIAMALSPDGTRVASGRSNGPDVELWDVATPWRNKLLKGHKGSLHGIAFSPDGNRIASANGDRTVKVWDANTFKELVTLTGHTRGVTSLAWTPDGSRIVSGGADHTVRIWDADSGLQIRTLAGHAGWVYDVAWSPDGSRIVSGCGDKTVKVWDSVTGAEIRTIAGHALEVYSVVWSPDGKRILSASGDKTVKIWDAATGEEIRTLRGHGDRIRRVALIPNHQRIVTAGWDGSLKVWDAETGYETLTLKAHTTVINNIAVSPDATLIISGGGDRTVKAWYAGLSDRSPAEE